jgi:hypothetical protein
MFKLRVGTGIFCTPANAINGDDVVVLIKIAIGAYRQRLPVKIGGCQKAMLHRVGCRAEIRRLQGQ